MNKRLIMMLIYIITIFSAVNFAQAPVIIIEPISKGVIEGQTADFLIVVEGDSLSYQWFKNDTLIVGATDSVYTTPVTVLSDNKSKFKCVVTNPSDTDTSDSATLYVTAIGSRVTEGIQLLYKFNETSGLVVHDSSGVGTPYNLDLDNPSAVTWTPKGMGVNDVAYINGGPPLTKVIDACKLSNEITIELWINPAYASQRDGARILTLSIDNYNSNFSILHYPDGSFNFRVRSTLTSNQSVPALATTAGTATEELTHLVFTRLSNGERKIYKNGVEIASDILGGDFSNWDSNTRFQLANEFSAPREWLGTFYLASVYDRALGAPEVVGNYSVGVNSDIAPAIVIEPNNLGLLVGQSAEFSVKAVGDSLSYKWRKNGIDILGATDSTYSISSVSLSDDRDLFSCVVSNSFGSDTSRDARLSVTAADSRVSSGQLALYTFQEGVGDTIKDVSGYGIPLDLKINSPSAVQWKPYGLKVISNADIYSIRDTSKVNTDVILSGEFTFEAWVKPENIMQLNSTIFTLRPNNTLVRRNFAMNQEGNHLGSWLRTSTTSDEGDLLNSPNNSLPDSLIHIIFTHNSKEVSKIFINGTEVASEFLVGDLGNWRPDYRLRLANNFAANQPWKGLYNLVSFYGRALNSNEILHNYSIGPLGIELQRPANLAAQANLPGKVELSWQDSSSNEDGFIIERKSGLLDFSVIDSVLVDVTSFTDSNVVDTTNYTYRVKAYNLLGESDFSNTVSATTLLSTLAAPTNLAASLSPTIVNRAQLSWQDNSSNELGFILERKTGDSASVDPFTVLDTLAADVTSFEDSILADTTTYTFRVKAFNSFTETGYSNFASVTTVLSGLNAPDFLSAKLFGTDSQYVQLNWQDKSTNELGFVIERKSGDSTVTAPFVVIDTVGTDVTTYVDSTVILDSTYTYRIFAFNTFTVSAYSNLADLRVPVELLSFVADIVSGKVLLRWETASETNNSGFDIQRSKDNVKFTDIAFMKGKGTTTDQSSYSYSDKSALSGKYYYRLKQVDFDGSVTYSKLIEVDLGVPKDYALEQNYPNPFNPSTTIRFALPINAKVVMKLYNALGQEVATILNTDLDAGFHETIYNASNLSSGVYFYMLRVQSVNGSNYTSTKRMILLK